MLALKETSKALDAKVAEDSEKLNSMIADLERKQEKNESLKKEEQCCKNKLKEIHSEVANLQREVSFF